jgi:pentatricopeptide repeat protein
MLTSCYCLDSDAAAHAYLQAQCTNHMHLPTALELVHEMRQRNVSPNTHTYSSMLNVCVKAGELDLALDVFNQVGWQAAIVGQDRTAGEWVRCSHGTEVKGAG